MVSDHSCHVYGTLRNKIVGGDFKVIILGGPDPSIHQKLWLNKDYHPFSTCKKISNYILTKCCDSTYGFNSNMVFFRIWQLAIVFRSCQHHMKRLAIEYRHDHFHKRYVMLNFYKAKKKKKKRKRKNRKNSPKSCLGHFFNLKT